MKEGKSVFNWEVRSCSPTARVTPRSQDEDCDYAENCPLAMAYTPMQKWRKLYSAEVALSRGTLFEELDKPFMGRKM